MDIPRPWFRAVLSDRNHTAQQVLLSPPSSSRALVSALASGTRRAHSVNDSLRLSHLPPPLRLVPTSEDLVYSGRFLLGFVPVAPVTNCHTRGDLKHRTDVSTALEARSPNARCRQGQALPRLWGRTLPCLLSCGGSWCPLAGGITLPASAPVFAGLLHCVRICVHMCVRARACAHVCTRMCMCVCMCLHVCVRACASFPAAHKNTLCEFRPPEARVTSSQSSQ